MTTSNPALNERAFTSAPAGAGTMTVDGTIMKSGMLLAILGLTFAFAWDRAMRVADPKQVMTYLLVAGISGLVLAMVTIFFKRAAPFTAPAYAAVEGVLLGVISAYLNAMYPGIALNAALITFAVFAVMLLAYRARIIQATEKFKTGVMLATGAIMLVYLIGWIMSMFGSGIPYIHEGGIIGIGFSLFVIVIAAMNLILNFDVIEKGAQAGAPKYMEWFAAFGLLVTLVWLYIEVLNLLAKLQRR